MPIDRRSILKTAAVAIAVPGVIVRCSSPAMAAPAADPLIDLINDYRSKLVEFNARAYDEPWDDLTERTYGPPFDMLCDAPPHPTTFAGAMAGIEFVLSELADNMNSDANEAVLRVCVDFLRDVAGRAT